jgi:hypothetical protein
VRLFLLKEELKMGMIYSNFEGITPRDFNKIAGLLKKGYDVDFSCGARYHGYTNRSDVITDEFKSHVHTWIEDIQEYYEEKYGRKTTLRFDYISPDNWIKVRLYSPFTTPSNKQAKHLLSNSY